MKTIDKLTSLDKATYGQKATFLHLLFPAQIPPFLDFAESFCNEILEEQTPYFRIREGERLSKDQWHKLIAEAKSNITCYRTASIESPYVFGKMLFNLDLPFVMVYCLSLYPVVDKTVNKRFAGAVKLFFDEPVRHWYDLPKVPEESIKKEYILCEENNPDAWLCVCGNMANDEGFYSCNTEGNIVEPVDNWDGLNVCMNCGRFFHQDTMLVLGRNYDPKPLNANDEP